MKKTLKFIALSLVLVLTLGLLVPALNTVAEEPKREFTVWAEGSDNVRIQLEKQIETFNETNEDGWVAKLEFIVSGTGTQGLQDRIIAAKAANQTDTDFDVLEFGDDNAVQYIERAGEDLFVEIDKDLVPNMEHLEFSSSFYPELLIPYRGTTVVLAYDSDTVEEPPKTTEELYQWIKDNPGRFAYNTPDSGGAGGSFVATSIYNFLPEEALTSNDKEWVEQYDEGFELLKELHPDLYKSSGKVVYPHKNQGTLDLLANKEVDIIPAWADMVLSQKMMGTMPESVKISQLDPSFTGSTVVWGIPSIGSNPEGAHAWINYMLSPEAQNIALETQAAIPVINFDLIDEELKGLIEGLDLEVFRLSSIGDNSTDLNERWNREIATLD